MRFKEFDIDPANVDPNGIAESQTPAAGGVQSLALDGALISGGVFTDATGGRRIILTAAGNETGRVFTVTGTDPDGYAQTGTLAGPNATTVESTEYWKTITGITVDADTADAIEVGTVDEIATQTIPLDRRGEVAATINVDITGTIDYTVQETFDDVQRPGLAPQSAHQNVQWIDISALADKSADTTSLSTVGAQAIRLQVNSYTDTAELQMNVNQPSSKY